MRKYDTLVKEGRKAVEADTDAKWMLGDLALEVAPIGRSKANTGALAKLDQFADDVGVARESLRHYRATAAAWPHERRLPCASFSVFQDLRGREDRVELLDRLANDTGQVTVDEARRAIGQNPTRPGTSGDRVEAARELLADPDIAAEVLADPKAYDNVMDSAYKEDVREERAATRQAARSPEDRKKANDLTAAADESDARRERVDQGREAGNLISDALAKAKRAEALLYSYQQAGGWFTMHDLTVELESVANRLVTLTAEDYEPGVSDDELREVLDQG